MFIKVIVDRSPDQSSTEQSSKVMQQSNSESHGGGGSGGNNNNGGCHESQHHSATRPRTGPLRSVEGWVLFITGVHEEAQEDDLMDAFSEHGTVNKVQINVDRQTGLAKGYAMVEYATQSEAQDAINTLHGTELLGKNIGVHWCFVKPTGGGGHDSRGGPS